MQTNNINKMVTTSTTVFTKSSNSLQQLANFITPQQMLRRLIPYAGKQNLKPCPTLNTTQVIIDQSSIHQKNRLIQQVQKLQIDLRNIHAQVIQSQNLLNVRNSLYQQLDMLRQQRQNIQNDIQCVIQQKQAINVKFKSGYKEMNQRLKRRMNQIREYIHKMELENIKIQQTIKVSDTYNMERNYYSQMKANAWVDNAYYHENSRSNYSVDGLIERLHQKQQQALQRVKRQQEDIQKRNYVNRNLLIGNQRTFYDRTTPLTAARSFYGPSQTAASQINSNIGRRYYSPNYRY